MFKFRNISDAFQSGGGGAHEEKKNEKLQYHKPVFTGGKKI